MTGATHINLEDCYLSFDLAITLAKPYIVGDDMVAIEFRPLHAQLSMVGNSS